MADSEGFEPSRRFPAYTLSRRAPSTTRPTVLKALYLLSLKNCNPLVLVLFSQVGLFQTFRIFYPDIALSEWDFDTLLSKTLCNLMINLRFNREHPINVSKNGSDFEI